MVFEENRLDVRRAMLVLTAATFLELSGCGWGGAEKTYPVTVKVAFHDGRTLEGAVVGFHPVGEKKYSAVGKVQADGTCRLTTFKPGDGAVAGAYRVTVGPPPSPPGASGKGPAASISRRFSSVETSGLEFTVTPEGPNECSILIDEPKLPPPGG